MSAGDHRLTLILGHVAAAGLLVGAMFWIALAEQKSWAILLGVGAILVTRYVYVTLPERLASDDAPEENDES
ncbi:MAG: hypothetical protein CMJ57_07315 [Planctomycetaceae bacterium]|nr:hypothetical protein [Planctomycetaceae bacterium]